MPVAGGVPHLLQVAGRSAAKADDSATHAPALFEAGTSPDAKGQADEKGQAEAKGGSDDGGKDVFVHITAVQAAGMSGLDEGQKVSFEVVRERGKEAAANLRPA